MTSRALASAMILSRPIIMGVIDDDSERIRIVEQLGCLDRALTEALCAVAAMRRVVDQSLQRSMAQPLPVRDDHAA